MDAEGCVARRGKFFRNEVFGLTAARERTLTPSGFFNAGNPHSPKNAMQRCFGSCLKTIDVPISA
jgi:hypothetical protein